MVDNKKTNVKVMDNITESEVRNLIEGLRKIEGFEFLVDAPFRIK